MLDKSASCMQWASFTSSIVDPPTLTVVYRPYPLIFLVRNNCRWVRSKRLNVRPAWQPSQWTQRAHRSLDTFMGLLKASQAADRASTLACLCALYTAVTSSVAPVWCSDRRTCSIPAVRQPGHVVLIERALSRLRSWGGGRWCSSFGHYSTSSALTLHSFPPWRRSSSNCPPPPPREEGCIRDAGESGVPCGSLVKPRLH